MKGVAKQLSVLFGLVVGYLLALCFGKVDFGDFEQAADEHRAHHGPIALLAHDGDRRGHIGERDAGA